MLTRLEEAILIAVLKLEQDAYGVPINKEVSRLCDRRYSLGGLYFALDQLVRKEYLMKQTTDSVPQRGGRSKTMYRLTVEGKEALLMVREHQINLWKSVPEESVFNKG